MKALSEIGFSKTFRYIMLSVYLIIVRKSLFPPIRNILLTRGGAQVGRYSVIHNTALFNFHHNGLKNLNVGNYCFIGDEVMLDLAENITLEDHVTIANRAFILTHTNVGYKNHPLQKYFPKFQRPVILKEGCFVGAGAIIMPGITIGERAYIAAGAVVTKNVPPETVAAGVPAQKLRTIRK